MGRRRSPREENAKQAVGTDGKWVGCVVSTEFHSRLKRVAIKQNVTLTGFLQEIIADSLRKFEQSEQCNG